MHGTGPNRTGTRTSAALIDVETQPQSENATAMVSALENKVAPVARHCNRGTHC